MDTLRQSRPFNNITSFPAATTFSIPPLPKPPNSCRLSSHTDPPAPVEAQRCISQGRALNSTSPFNSGNPTPGMRYFYPTFVLCVLQFLGVVAILIFATKTKSPTNPSLNQWQACSRPLGIWDALWAPCTCISTCLAYRNRAHRARTNDHGPDNSGAPIPGLCLAHSLLYMFARHRTATALPSLQTSLSLKCLPDFLILCWFLAAQIIFYISSGTCRYSSPCLFWLMAAILGMLYLFVLGFIMIKLAVHILIPLLLSFRNGIQVFIPGPSTIKPEITPVPLVATDFIPSVVDDLPLPRESALNTERIITPPLAHLSRPSPRTPTIMNRHDSIFIEPSSQTVASGSEDIEKTSQSSAKQHRKLWQYNQAASKYPYIRLDGMGVAWSICRTSSEDHSGSMAHLKNADVLNAYVRSEVNTDLGRLERGEGPGAFGLPSLQSSI